MKRKLLFFTTATAVVLACGCKSGTAVRPTVPDATPESSAVVARIDGLEIRAAEVDGAVRGGLIRAEVEYREAQHGLRKQALDELINQRLVERQAKAQGLTAGALLDRDVHSKVAPAGDDELRAVYAQAKASGEELPPFDDLKPEVARFVRQQRLRQALDAYHEQLRAQAKVETLLPAPVLPRVEVAAVGPSIGAEGAPVTIIAFSDYECPFCRRAEPAIKSVLEAYGAKVRLIYKEYPLPNHRHAQKASEAALCAHDQGKYWQMQEKLFANQDSLEVGSLKDYARAVGLDTTRFDRCLDDGAKVEEVEASRRAGDQAGVAGTPAFYINGRPLAGAASFEKFKEVIDAELAAGPARK